MSGLRMRWGGGEGERWREEGFFLWWWAPFLPGLPLAVGSAEEEEACEARSGSEECVF